MNLEQILSMAQSENSGLNDKDEVKIFVGPLAGSRDSDTVLNIIRTEIDKIGIKASLIKTGSSGYYDLDPIIRIQKPDQSLVFYPNVTPEIIPDLINESLSKGSSRSELAPGISGKRLSGHLTGFYDLPLGDLEKRIALRNCGRIDPENIGHYILLNQGYSGLSRALQMSPGDVIEELRKSGLRGRGGAGYFTAKKWKICHGTPDSEKYLVCNAVDADPLARTARLLLESDPHSVLEGMLIGAYSVGASHCFIGLNAGFALALKRLKMALEQMREYRLLGSHILDSNFSTEIEIKEVPVSLVSGEETALLRSLEEKQAMPYLRPPYPAMQGLADRPTLIDNAETLSDVSAILQKGPDWFSSIGTAQSKGSKVVTLAGDVIHKYTVEVPFGTTLQSVIEKAGGGVPPGQKIKAVQFGGPTGAYIAADSLDLQIDYETVTGAESVIGSGTIEVFDSDSCAVEITQEKMAYLHDQSCGKCVFCREGTHQMSDILEDIAQSRGKSKDLDLLVELGEGMKLGCICGLGSSAPNPVLSSLKLFRGEYEAHLRDKKCPLRK